MTQIIEVFVTILSVILQAITTFFLIKRKVLGGIKRVEDYLH